VNETVRAQIGAAEHERLDAEELFEPDNKVVPPLQPDAPPPD
jgi:hypothetical protein